MAALPANALLAPVRQIHGFVLACLVDASTGMILGAVQDQDDMPVPVAAAGTADVIGVLSMMTSELALNGAIQDVIVTLDSHYHLIRVLSRGPGREFLLLVTLQRPQSNLAMALREIRDLSADIFDEPTGAAATD